MDFLFESYFSIPIKINFFNAFIIHYNYIVVLWLCLIDNLLKLVTACKQVCKIVTNKLVKSIVLVKKKCSGTFILSKPFKMSFIKSADIPSLVCG